tara:strand:- start:107 stop:817 length:711 start_codon:yes stop_codon:yes gene_type:complete
MKKLFLLSLLLILSVHLTAGNQVDRVKDGPFYLAENGITIKAKDSVLVGTQAMLNGITYTLVNDSIIYDSLLYQIVTTPWSDISECAECMGSQIKYSKDGKSFQFVGDINDEFEFVGLVQNFIILSYGGMSSAESSDPFWIFDLENQKYVFQSDYYGGLRIVNSKIEYVQVVYNPYESYDSTFIKTVSKWSPKCSDKIEKLRIEYPGSIGYTEKIIFDVSTLKSERTGVYECQYFQ